MVTIAKQITQIRIFITNVKAIYIIFYIIKPYFIYMR